MRRAALLAATAAVIACAPRVHAPRVLEPLGHEGELLVYLQPFPEEAARLALSVEAVRAVRSDGAEVPLELLLPEIAAGTASRQRLLASGRVPPGRYTTLAVKLRRATLARDEGPADLLVGSDPVRIDLAVELPAGGARVVRVTVPPRPVDESFDLATAFRSSSAAPEGSQVPLSTYVPSTASASVAIIDRRTKQVTAVIPTGREPQGLAVDALAQRGYVALAGEDQLEVIDLATGHDLNRVMLRAGDDPREVALTRDGRVALVTNPRSNTLSFVDTRSGMVVDRVATGQEPGPLLLGPGGRRAYVLNRRSNDITVVDVGNRAVAGTLAAEPEPIRAAINRDETRLYVVHRGSPYLKVFSLPDLGTVTRLHVGLGASAVRVDSRTDLVYVASASEARVQVFDPRALLPMDAIALPGPASFLTIDDVENTLVAVLPAQRAVAFVDLTSRRLVGVADVGPEPFQAAVVGERP
jgi:YVTN family beta-propeller protein